MPSYVITGASRGLGLEFVRQLSSKPGNQVFAIVRNKSTASSLVEIGSRASNVHVLQADIVDHKALKEAAAEVAAITGGTLDYLINNAAFMGEERRGLTLDGYPEGQESLLEEDIHKSIHVNVIGVIHTINAFLPLIRRGTTKKVITLSTGLADPEFTLASGFAVAAPYSISKAALNLAVVKYAAAYQSEGVVFLSISPGLVNTAQKPPTPEELEEFKAMLASFKKAAPDWNGQPLTPEESVKLMLGVFEGITIKDSGAFISQYGNKEWL